MTDPNDRYLPQEVSDAMDDAGDQAGVFCRCEPCGTKLAYQPTAVRLTWLIEQLPLGQQVSCYYEFFCAHCHALNQHPLGPDVGVILADAGVMIRKFVLPAEVTERAQVVRDAPPLTEDDLAAFLENIQVSL